MKSQRGLWSPIAASGVTPRGLSALQDARRSQRCCLPSQPVPHTHLSPYTNWDKFARIQSRRWRGIVYRKPRRASSRFVYVCMCVCVSRWGTERRGLKIYVWVTKTSEGEGISGLAPTTSTPSKVSVVSGAPSRMCLSASASVSLPRCGPSFLPSRGARRVYCVPRVSGMCFVCREMCS